MPASEAHPRTAASHAGEQGDGAWNPGLSSSIPRRLRPQISLFETSNASLDYATVCELADLCGLPATELASLRTRRLIAHELLVRVTADFSVPDGPNYADLGISLRSMVGRLMDGYVMPELEALRVEVDAARARAAALVEGHLNRTLFPERLRPAEEAPETSPGPVIRLLRRLPGGRSVGGSASARARARQGTRASVDATEPREQTALRVWRAEMTTLEDPLETICLSALVRAVDAIVAHRGRLLASPESLVAITLALAGNRIAEAVIGERIGPIVQRGADAEGYRRLPSQTRPIVMNVKGASASGKSTIRPRQRHLADTLGVPWEDFALISPDYWRKYLLDYESLGDDRRYGAMLCGEELAIIDRKLDLYMADKAARGEMSHLLIDRFRFDSFALEQDRTADSRLLTRFGHEIYLFFMVTPPAETVSRAWIRGLQTGRFKAVDDLLHHNVEAFTGMPALFLSWVAIEDRRVHFEFLDNDVPEGTLPATAAFGVNGRMTILDVRLMRDIDRNRQVNVAATTPDEVLPSFDAAGADDWAFLKDCIARIDCIDFADSGTAEIFARVVKGNLVWSDAAAIAAREDAADVLAVLDALPASGGAGDTPALPPEPPPPIDVAAEARLTVGSWAPASCWSSTASDDDRV